MDQPLVKIPTRVAGIRFQKVTRLYYFDCSQFPDLTSADHVIVETARGRQMGKVVNFVDPDKTDRDYKPILRIATPRDLLMKQHWDSKAWGAVIDCREQASQLGGYEDCKFMDAVFSYDGSMLTMLFSSEDTKINTNRLRTGMSNLYKAKIEFRQIGPRDVAKLQGGFGACGIERCCSVFLTDFSPISIKMAKAQGISLNPSEITGMCGRLRCCLVYEYEQYVEARKDLPKRNKRVVTPHGEGKVVDVHPLQQAVTVLVEEAYFVVKKEDLQPLDELEALERKAKGGCSKHDGGGCDCGARRTKSEVDADEDDEVSNLDE
jgi:cell fate regulator YaaT (PSP1 superfamily)